MSTLINRRSRSGIALLGLATALVCGAGAAAAHAAAAQATASAARCRVRALQLARPQASGAAGSIGLLFTFTNRGNTTCEFYGYPGMLLRNANRRPMPTTVIRGTSTVVPPEPERAVLVAPGKRASFYAGYSDVPTGKQSCPRSAYAEVTPPNDYNHLTVALTATACGGRITVSPVIAGVPRI